MPNTTSPNMGLIVPGVATEPGPAWASDLNADLGILDQHNHSSGQGVKITPAGININVDLPMNQNNLTNVETVNFHMLGSPLAGSAPNLGCVYVAGNELYYNDEAGNVVQITNNGSVNAGAGSITGLPSGTASASYSSGNQTFVWQSATSTAANMDMGSIILRDITPGSHGVTINPPGSLAADYSLTLPAALPGSDVFLTLDSSGNIGDVVAVDNATLIISSNLLQVNADGIQTANIADGAVTSTKTTPNVNQSFAPDGSTHSSNFATSPVTIVSYVLVCDGNHPVQFGLNADFQAGNQSYVLADNAQGPVDNTSYIEFIRNGTTLTQIPIGPSNTYYPTNQFFMIDRTPPAGSNTYVINAVVTHNGSDTAWLNVGGYAFEIA